jgi:hypothetical protein
MVDLLSSDCECKKNPNTYNIVAQCDFPISLSPFPLPLTTANCLSLPCHFPTPFPPLLLVSPPLRQSGAPSTARTRLDHSLLPPPAPLPTPISPLPLACTSVFPPISRASLPAFPARRSTTHRRGLCNHAGRGFDLPRFLTEGNDMTSIQVATGGTAPLFQRGPSPGTPIAPAIPFLACC